MDVEPIFQSAQYYPPMEWRYLYEIHIDDELERISQHELWSEMTENYYNNILVRQRLIDSNRLIKTITHANASKIPKNNDIWKDEELGLSKESEMGQGLGGQDLYYLYKNLEGYEERAKMLSKGMMTTIQENDKNEEYQESGQQQSTTRVDEDEDVVQTLSSKPYQYENLVGNASMVEGGPDDSEQQLLAREVECSQHQKSSSWAAMVEDELDDQLREARNARPGEDSNGFGQEIQNTLSPKPESSTSDTAAESTDDPELAHQASAASILDSEQSRPTKEGTSANEIPDKTNGQVHQCSFQNSDNDVDPGKYLRLQRRKCIDNGIMVLRLKYNTSEGDSPKPHCLDARARSLRLDARKPLTELCAEDIEDTEYSHIITPQQTPAQELTERLNELRLRDQDLNTLRNKILPEMQPSLIKLMVHLFDCYFRYYYNRVSLLEQWTLPKFQPAWDHGHYRRAVLYALFLDKLLVRTKIAQIDPKRQQWEVHQDYDTLTELFNDITKCVKNGKENSKSLFCNRSFNGPQPETTLSDEIQERVTEIQGPTDGKGKDARFDAFVDSIFADDIWQEDG